MLLEDRATASALGTAIGGEDLFAHAEALGSHFDELVIGDELDGLLEGEDLEGDEAESVVRTGSAHVGELLFANGVDVEVVVARVLADEHAFVDFDSVADEEDAAFLYAVKRVGGGDALAVGDEGAGGALRNLTLVGDVLAGDRVHDDGAASLGEHFVAQADETAGGNLELHADAAGAVIGHLDHLTFSGSEALDDGANEVFGDVDGEDFGGLHEGAFDTSW